MKKKIFCFGIALLFFMAFASYIHAAGVTLAWDKPTDGGPVEGYKLYWRTSSGSYNDANSITIAGEDSTSETVSGLDENETYYFIVRAYNNGGANLSDPSNVVEWSSSDTTPPLPPEGVSAE